MVMMDVVKLRWIFDSVATDIDAVVSENAQLEQDVARLRSELLVARAQLEVWRTLKDTKDRNVAQLLKARQTIRKLKKDAKTRKSRG